MSKIPTIAIIPSGYKANKVYSVLPTNGDADLATTRASTATRVNQLGLIEEIATGVPRLDYSNGGCPSLLVEPQSTNVITHSEDFSDASWVKASGGTGSVPIVTANQEVSPKGDLTATKITLNSGSGTTLSDQSRLSFVDALSTNDYNGSLYLKGVNGGEQIQFIKPNASTQLITLTNEWQRFDFTETASASTVNRVGVQIRQGLDGTINSSATFYIWGAQLEQLPYATSYIPTNGSTSTRVAETCSKTGLSSYIGQSEGTIFINGLFTTNSSIFHINNSFANQIIVGKLSTGVIRVIIYNSSTATTLNSINTFTNYSDALKIAIRYKNQDSKVYINGVEEVASADTITFNSNLDSVHLSQDYFFPSEKSEFKDLRVYNQALTDSELQTLTS